MLLDGEIVERGTHQKLLDQTGTYADMWERQQEAREAAAKLDQLNVGE